MPQEAVNQLHEAAAMRGRELLREFRIDNMRADEQGVYEMSVSSDDPYEFFNWNGVKFVEVLDHKKESADLSRMNDSGQILYNHDRHEYIGVSLKAWVDGGKAYVRFRFSNREKAQQIKRDIDDGILRNVSIGYRIDEETREDIKNDKDEVVEYRWTVTRWRMLEASVVTVPADPTVGIGRGIDTREAAFDKQRKERISSTIQKEDNSMTTPANIPAPIEERLNANAAAIDGLKSKLEALTADDSQRGELAAKIKEAERQQAIREAALLTTSLKPTDRDILMNEHLANEEKTAQDFQLAAVEKLKELQTQAPEEVNWRSKLGMTGRDIMQYDIARLIRSMESGEPCLEMEIAQELRQKKADAEKAGGYTSPKRILWSADGKRGEECESFIVPADVLINRGVMAGIRQNLRAQGAIKERTVNTGSGSAQSLIDEDHMASSWIDTLRDMAVVLEWATVLPGLQGDIQIPRLTTNSTATRIAEDGSATDSSPVFDEVTMSILTSAAAVPITRRILQQGTPGVQAIIMANIAHTMALHLDTQMLTGDGSGQNSTGIFNISGITSASFTEFDGTGTYARYADLGIWKLSKLIQAMMEDNAFRGRLGYLFAPKFWQLFYALETYAGTTGRRLIEGTADRGTLEGIPYRTKTGDLGNKILLANWNDFYVGFWEMLELVLDRSTKIASGGLVIRAFSDFNSAVRHPESFAVLGQA